VNISVSGIALVLERRFEPGAILSIRLQSPDARITRNLLLRVVYANARDDGSWQVGCAFGSQLREHELQAFQVTPLQPAESDFRAWVRFPCDVETVCREATPQNDEKFVVRVQEVSPTGIRLLAPRRYERDTLLNMEVPGVVPVGASRRCVQVRVVTDRPFNSKEWLLSCELADQISDQELQNFQ
jgi:hypothetical protein